MSVEKENLYSGRLPKDVYEQLSNLPSREVQNKICTELYDDVAAILVVSGVMLDLEKSSYRVKSEKSIEEKIKTRASIAPIRDLHGLRYIMIGNNRKRLEKIIQDYFPLTPAVFPDGRPSVKEYANAEVRDYMRKNFNPNISSEYSALHINIVFQREESQIYDIAEVQIMTEEELAKYNETREGYINGRSK